MAALIFIKLCLAWLPTWVPDCVTVFYKEIVTVVVQRHIVVAIACKTAETGICIERISTGCIGNE